MNIKIKANGVHCKIGDDYDRLYALLKSQFGDGPEQIFSERIPGNDYLQWNLPGDGWKSLGDDDPIMAEEVRAELRKRKQTVRAQFGTNHQMADKVLSVPDENYVFYKSDNNGKLIIRLTAWGYMYPEKIGGGGATGLGTKPVEKADVVVRTLINGENVACDDVQVNGYNKTNEDDGLIHLGQLPVGYEFDIVVKGEKRHIMVQPGDNVLTFDITPIAIVVVQVTKDGRPWAGRSVSVDYNGQKQLLTTGTDGTASAKLTMSSEPLTCFATVDDQTKQKMLIEGNNEFAFVFATPKTEEPIIPKMPEIQEPEVTTGNDTTTVEIADNPSTNESPTETDELPQPGAESDGQNLTTNQSEPKEEEDTKEEEEVTEKTKEEKEITEETKEEKEIAEETKEEKEITEETKEEEETKVEETEEMPEEADGAEVDGQKMPQRRYSLLAIVGLLILLLLMTAAAYYAYITIML